MSELTEKQIHNLRLAANYLEAGAAYKLADSLRGILQSLESRRAQPEANADAKDAERYRWYRSCGDERDQLAILDARGNIIPEELDAEIDARIAAIQAQKDGHAE